MRLLLVEDSSRLRELLTEAVHGAGWRVDAVATIGEATEAVAVTPYDLLLVDLGLPDGDGLDLVRAFRRNSVKTPILVLTARAAIDERISGLDAGADDYLVKPFNNGEFLARCRALLRRAPDTKTPILLAAQLSLDWRPAPRHAPTSNLVLRLANAWCSKYLCGTRAASFKSGSSSTHFRNSATNFQ